MAPGYGDLYCIGKNLHVFHRIFLQYKGIWAWRNFRLAKIFTYTVVPTLHVCTLNWVSTGHGQTFNGSITQVESQCVAILAEIAHITIMLCIGSLGRFITIVYKFHVCLH